MKNLPETRADAIQAFKKLQEENVNLKLEVSEYKEQAEKVPGLETEITSLKSKIAKAPTPETKEVKLDGLGWAIEGE